MRKPDKEKDKLICKLRSKGKTFREISDITGIWLSVVYRRYSRHCKKLSTESK